MLIANLSTTNETDNRGAIVPERNTKWDWTVLLVEDEAVNRRILAKILSRYVAQVVEAVDGLDAWQQLETLTPDLISTDLNMPRLDGLALIRRLREAGNRVPVLVLSAHNETHILAQAADLEAFRFLFKPVRVELVVAALEEISAAR